MKKILKGIFVTALFAVALAGFVPTVASATEFEKSEFKKFSNVNEIDTMAPTMSFDVSSSSDDAPQYKYIEFNLKSDSWVYLKGSYSNKNFDTGETAVDLYTDKDMKNAVDDDLCLSFGTGTYKEEGYGFLKAGTYYAKVTTKKKPWYWLTSGYGKEVDFIATCDLKVVSYPVSDIFATDVKVSKDKKSATVTWKNKLGKYLGYAQYQAGNISFSKKEDKGVWKRCFDKGLGVYDGGKDAKLFDLKSDTVTFKVTNNGAYTILLHSGASFAESARYSKAFKVSGIDKTKPVVTGVKNNKTYKKAVTIKFKDTGSGVKSAKLNNKTIKSGKKVSKVGSYKLVVTDKAGNKTTVKFKIKK